MVAQQSNLFTAKNVFNNIALPLELRGLEKSTIVAAVNKVAEFVGLTEKLSLHPQQLTQAQKQKVSIARALVINPKVLLCDEITAGLDNKTTQSILQLLKEINQEMKTTIVIITHDPEVIKALCNRICIMHQGEIIEQTSALELFLHPRTEIAKDFIRASTRLEMPWSYRRNLHVQPFKDSHPILRVVFTGCVPSEILIAHAIENFQIKTIIIQAHQEIIQNNILNVLLMEVIGNPDNIADTFKYFRDNNLHIETLGYVNNNT
jgi:D-methionine transport system ATP-binding protein